MQIKSILTLDRTLCDVTASSKKRVLEFLTQHLNKLGLCQETADPYAALLERERLGSTGIGDGVALPHCRLPGLNQTIGILMTLQKPVNFDAIDGNPVDLVFALIVPEEQRDEHLQILAAIAKLLQDPTQRDKLRNAHTAAALYELAIIDTH